MKQRSSFLLFSTALALIVAGCGKQEAASTGGDTIKIGLAAPLTGTQPHIGLDIKNGTQLGIEELNAQGLEIGGKKVKFELMAEDDEANPAKATTVAQRFMPKRASLKFPRGPPVFAIPSRVMPLRSVSSPMTINKDRQAPPMPLTP